MTENTPEKFTAPDSLPNFVNERRELKLDHEKAPGLITNLQYVSELTGVTVQKLFERAISLGFRADELTETPEYGLFRKLEWGGEKLSPADPEYNNDLPINSKIKKNLNDIDIPTACIKDQYKTEIVDALLGRNISVEELLLRSARLGTDVFLNVIGETENYYFLFEEGLSVIDYINFHYDTDENLIEGDY